MLNRIARKSGLAHSIVRLILRAERGLAALSLRMEGAAIALLMEADRRDRRVTIEKDAILIDGRRLTGIGEGERVTQRRRKWLQNRTGRSATLRCRLT